jgi:hypothetical protein
VIAASYCQLDFASSAVGDNMVVCAETAIGRSIVPAVFSSSPSPEVTPPLQPSRERESRERVSGRGGGFQSGPLLAPQKNLEFPSHDHRSFGPARDRHASSDLASGVRRARTAQDKPRAEQLIKMVSPAALILQIPDH